MNLADEWLGVAQLLTPEELVNPKVDELSMMTYLAQFRKAKVREGAPIQTENQNTQLVGSGMEPFEPLLTKDAAEDEKQSEEAQRNIEIGDKPSSNLSSSREEDATKGHIVSSLNNPHPVRGRACCTYFFVVLIAVIVSIILTRQYASRSS